MLIHFNCIIKVGWINDGQLQGQAVETTFQYFTFSFYPITVPHYSLDITRCKTNIHQQVSPTIEGLARYPWDVWHIFLFAGQLGCWQCSGWCSSVHSVGLSASRPWKPLCTIENDILIFGRPSDRYSRKGWGLFPLNKFVISNVSVLQISHNVIIRHNTPS